MTQTRAVKVAVVGASGYTGGELLRLIVGHPKMTLAVVTSEKSAGSPVSAVFPHLASLVPFSFESLAPEAIAARAEAVFFSLPHTKSFAPVAASLWVRLAARNLEPSLPLKFALGLILLAAGFGAMALAFTVFASWKIVSSALL